MICAAVLVLLLDASGSVIAARQWDSQVEGHARAFEAPEFSLLLRNGPVALSALAFADDVAPLVPWVVVRDEADAHGFAAALRATLRAGPPSVGLSSTNFPQALRGALQNLNERPCEADKEVIDLVTDGQGPSPAEEIAFAAAEGVQVNALLVSPQEDDVEFAREHLRTPSGFVTIVESWEGFERAIRRKIFMEVGFLKD